MESHTYIELSDCEAPKKLLIKADPKGCRAALASGFYRTITKFKHKLIPNKAKGCCWSSPKSSSSSRSQAWRLRRSEGQSKMRSAQSDHGRTQSLQRRHSQTMPEGVKLVCGPSMGQCRQSCLKFIHQTHPRSKCEL